MLFLFLFAILTGLGSLVYTRFLVNILKAEERIKVEQWAEATRLITMPDSSHTEFLSSIIENNISVPVILTDGTDAITGSKNFDEIRTRDPEYLSFQLEKIKKKNKPIIIDYGNGYTNLIYYKDSIILTQLNYYPYVQLGIILLFILVAYLAFRSSRKAEENQVWVGLSKETAHQLGTPTSSLAGWIEMLQHKYPQLSISRELALDVERLEKITERFSKIGSKPVLVNENIIDIISNTIEYLKSRTSSKVRFITEFDPNYKIEVPLNTALFEWVIENISKNAIDAMEGEGEINIRVTETEKNVLIDITDTGKGIPKSSFKKIFTPGYTTKQRGWGLGLSLTKRIVEEFHKGRIFVRHSELGKGSCIRIVLNR
jgi:signal transduction histidine kinase